MSDRPVQNYANHPKFPTSLVICTVLFIVAVLMATAGLILVKTQPLSLCLIGTAVLITGLAGIYALLITRTYATGLQDRIIRTEMRIRLEKVLPADQHGVITTLTIPQLVGLRFASDGELPELVHLVVRDKLEKAKPIKKLVKHWQADHDRV